MHCISKHFTADNYEQLILEQSDYSEYVWKALLDIFGLTEAEKIVVSEYKLEARGEQNG